VPVLWIALSATLVGAESETGAKAGRAASMRIAVRAGGSLRVPRATGTTRWRPYPAAGGAVELPTRLDNLCFAIGAEIGAVESYGRQHRFHILHGHLGLAYAIPLFSEMVWAVPELALSNATIRADEASPFSLAVIGVSENEFGVRAGTTLRMVFGRITLSAPFAVNHVFSAPDPFVEGVGSLMLGYSF
jgi:hypothetical protein